MVTKEQVDKAYDAAKAHAKADDAADAAFAAFEDAWDKFINADFDAAEDAWDKYIALKKEFEKA